MQKSISENQSADGSEGRFTNISERAEFLAGKSPVKDNQKFNIYAVSTFKRRYQNKLGF